MDKKLFLLIFLTSCFAVAQAQQSNGVTVSNFKASGTDLVDFTVSWDNTLTDLWSDSVWVFVDYRDGVNMKRLKIAGATVTPVVGTATLTQVSGNTDGFYVIGDARTNGTGRVVANVSVKAQDPQVFGACAYAINYPPLAKYNGDFTQITFTGSPLFILTFDNGKELESGKSFMVPSGYTLTSFTDATGAPGRIVYPSAEAFEPDSNAPIGTTWTIRDSRDNKEYKVRKMADDRIWMIQDLRYGGANDACNNRTSFAGTTSSAPTNRFGTGTYGDCQDKNPNVQDVNAGYLYDWAAAMQHPDAYSGGNYPGVNGATSGTAWLQGICPVGFHVPTPDEFADAYNKFKSAYNCDKAICWNTASQWQGVSGGWCDSGGSPTSVGTIIYWSSLPNNSVGAYHMRFDNGTSNPSLINGSKNAGLPLRCIRNY